MIGEPQALEDARVGVPQALLLLEAVDGAGAGVTHASVSKDNDLRLLLFKPAGCVVETGGDDGADGADGADAEAPKSKRSPRPDEAVALAGEGFAGAKKPPEAGLDNCGAAGVFFIPAVRLAKGDGLGRAT